MERLVSGVLMVDLKSRKEGRIHRHRSIFTNLCSSFVLLPDYVTHKKHHDKLLPTSLGLSYSAFRFVVFVLAV